MTANPENERPPAREVVVSVRQTTKTFRDFWRRPKAQAVDDLDLDVRRGEIFGLLGPNGSGKSTTIKMILGLLHADGGRIEVFGQSPNQVKTKRRIGYLPEESYLYKYLNPVETLRFYGRLFDLKQDVIEARIWQLLDMVGLRHAAQRPVGEFSKGMARRIGLAQALLNDPELIILDEPTSGLDPIGCRQVKDLMLELVQRGKTIILSSHLLADVEDVCDRIAILYAGRIRAEGSVRDLLRKEDRLSLTVPVLEPEMLQQVLKVLRKKTGVDPAVEHPSIDLEQFFLRTVADAHSAQGRTSGVGATTGLADFLRKEG